MRDAPHVFVFDVEGCDAVIPSSPVQMMINDEMRVWSLRSVMYRADHHYTSRYIDVNSLVWFHDGISTGRCCTAEPRLSLPLELVAAQGGAATHYVYVQC